MSAAATAHPWDGYLFALVCPDAVAKRVVTPIVTRLVDGSFSVVRSCPVQVTPQRSDDTFGVDVMERGDPYRFRLLDVFFDYGPSLALILHDNAMPAGDAGHRRMRRLKGATDPVTSDEGTVRRDFGGINVLLGLLHTADSPQRSAWEAATLAPELRSSADAVPSSDGNDWRTIARLLDTGPAETRDFDAVVHGLRSRVLATGWSQLTPRAKAALDSCLAADALADVGAGAEIAADLAPGPLAALLRAEWRPGLPALTARQFRVALGSLDLPLDRWEELVLITSAAFAPRSRRSPVLTNGALR